jgi:two-component system LytT family response regulator
MKTLIIEDETPAAERLEKMLLAVNPQARVLAICNSVNSSVKWLQSNTEPELILMDIEIADGRSFEIFDKVTITSPVIFTTAYDEFAIKAIKLNALDYLLKPVKKEELAAALEKVKELKKKSSGAISELNHMAASVANGNKPRKLAVSSLECTELIELENIVRMEADSNYTHIYLKDKKHITASRTLKEYEELLSTLGFFRVNKAHIINLSHIGKLLRGDGGYVLMTDGKQIEISPVRKKELLQTIALL